MADVVITLLGWSSALQEHQERCANSDQKSSDPGMFIPITHRAQAASQSVSSQPGTAAEVTCSCLSFNICPLFKRVQCVVWLGEFIYMYLHVPGNSGGFLCSPPKPIDRHKAHFTPGTLILWH